MSKGLSFVPSKKADSFQTRIELFRFFRSVKLRAFFDKGATNTSELETASIQAPSFKGKNCLKPKSTFMPPTFNSSVATFCRLVDQDVTSLFHPTNKNNACYPNVSVQEKKALMDLSNDNSIVLRNADKGGAIVIQNKESYRAEILRQLSNNEFYTALSYDPTVKFSQETYSFLKKAFDDQLVSKNEFAFMHQEHPIRPVFYTLPKVHKSLLEPVPGRPIVAGTQSLTEPMSQYIDLHIKLLVSNLPSFLKDTMDFLNKLNSIQNIQATDLLCTMDVASLYTNVPHKEGLEAMAYFLNQREVQTPSTEFLVNMTELVLNKNYFKFENSFYLQCQGVSMGSPCSPNYANLFMGKFEEDFVYHNNPFALYLRCWFRYIDDVFFIFTGTTEQLEGFRLYINSRMSSINFTLEFSRESVSFLDVMVKMDQQVSTSVYKKKTDRNNYLHFSSYHPPGLKKGLPYSQLLRVKRICSTETAFEKQAKDLNQCFNAKGYNNKVLNECLHKVRNVDRTSLLTSKLSRPGEPKIVLSTTYSPICNDVKKIVQKYWYILATDPTIGHVFKTPPLFAYKRAPNLRNSLVRADCYVPPKHFMSDPRPGNFPCSGCLQCNAMIKGDTVLHPHTGKKITIRSRITCKTKYVVYLLKCPCGLCYVGKTKRELKIRIGEHKSNIRNRDEKSPVARHFNSAGHEVCSLRFQGIEAVQPLKRGGNRDRLLLQREARWIHNLQTEHPKGLNEELLLGCFL